MNLARSLAAAVVVIGAFGALQRKPTEVDALQVLLYSAAIGEQRQALSEILARPPSYTLRLQQLLREYPKLVRIDWQAANRAVYTAALLRDPSFARILVSELSDQEVLNQCLYDCSVVFALAIFACFGGWNVPPDLDTGLTTVYDLRATIRQVQQLSLERRSLDAWIGGSPTLQAQWKEMEAYTEDQLLRAAVPDSPRSLSLARSVAVYALAATVATSRNRVEL